MDVTVETRIARPLAEVAAYVTEPANEPRWIRGIEESEQLTPGPIAVGSRVRRVASFLGRRMEYTPEVIEFEPLSRLVMQTDQPFPMRIAYTFAERDGATTFSQRLTGGPGGPMRLMAPLMTIMVKRNVRRDMAQLKARLEDPSG